SGMAAPARGRRGAGVPGDRAAQRHRLRHASARGAQQRPQARDEERDDRRGDALRGRAGARGGEAAEAGPGGDRAGDRGAVAAGDQANRRTVMLIKLLKHDGWRFALCVAVAVVLAGCAHETPEQRRVAATLTVAESCDAYTAASRTVRPHVEAGLLT